MTSIKLDWKPNSDFPVGKGATVQQFVATVGDETPEIRVAPWGEGHLRANGREIARSTTPRTGARPSAGSSNWPTVTSRNRRSSRKARGSPV